MNDAPPCQNYEVECETLGRLCESLGIDCSGAYDKADLLAMIHGRFTELREQLAKMMLSAQRWPMLEDFDKVMVLTESQDVLARCIASTDTSPGGES